MVIPGDVKSHRHGPHLGPVLSFDLPGYCASCEEVLFPGWQVKLKLCTRI